MLKPMCVASCPEATPAKDENTCMTCAQATESERPYWHPENRTCTEACPEDTPALENTNKCTICYGHDRSRPVWSRDLSKCISCAELNPEKPFLNPQSYGCVAACPDKTPAYREDHVCTTCAAIHGEKGPQFWDGEKCVEKCAEGTFLPQSGAMICVSACDLYQEPKTVEGSENAQCFCKPGLVFNETMRICVPDAEHSWENLQAVCSAENRSTNLMFTECVPACAQNETSFNHHCGCADGFALSADRVRCVSKTAEDCPRTLDMDDRVPRGETCVLNATCDPATYKLSLDEKKCVTTCALWFEDKDSHELRCVSECPDWWYTEHDGFCENDEWKLDVAVSVPVVIVIAAAILAGVFIAKHKKRPGKWQDITEEMKDRLA